MFEAAEGHFHTPFLSLLLHFRNGQQVPDNVEDDFFNRKKIKVRQQKLRRMKNILLATDFSQNAQIAAICAAELAGRLGGRLILFHALPFPGGMQEEKETGKKKSPEALAQHQLDTLASELHSRFGISISRFIKPGRPEIEIPSLAESLKARLVVVGAKGTGLRQAAMGSVADSLLRKDDLPVVCVPPAALLTFAQQLALMLEKEQQLCNTIAMSFLTDLRLHPDL